MAEVNHRQVMLGLLRITRGFYGQKSGINFKCEHSKPLRGILFIPETESQKVGTGIDLLNTGISYPISIDTGQVHYKKPTIEFYSSGGQGLMEDDFWEFYIGSKLEICDYISLGPLLEHLGMTGNLATDDFERLRDEILTNKSWLLENKELFGLVALSYGRFFEIKIGARHHILPIEIANMIIDIHRESRKMRKCLQLTKKERKLLGIID